MESYIYVIASREEGPVKIGYSDDPSRRLKQLQTGHPETLRIFYQEEIGYGRRKASLLERIIHKQNVHKRLKGEWYDLTVENAILEVQYAIIRFGEDGNLYNYV
jgi:T5orf172 domain.